MTPREVGVQPPWTGSALVFHLKPAFFEIYKILLDTDKQKSWRELTVQ